MRLVPPLQPPEAAMLGQRKEEGIEMEVRSSPVLSEEDRNDLENNGSRSSNLDHLDMKRMGKQQELVRHFRFFSVASFSAMATAAWELAPFSINPGLVNGGRPALIYSLLWNCAGFFPIYLSLAEMASMDPIAGSQYHWVSEFAPDSLQKFLSYITGWTSTLAWQSGNAQGCFLIGTLTQALIKVNKPDYDMPRWHCVLITLGATLVSLGTNILGAKSLHRWQNVVFVVHIMAFIAFIVPIWVSAPRASSKEVWTGFEQTGGWFSTGFAVLVGQLPGILSQTGVDSAAHMAEEVRDAAWTVPRVMMAVFAINNSLNILVIITLVYHLPDIQAALGDPTTFPTIYILRESMSHAWLTVIVCIILFLVLISTVTYLAAVSRDLWAFSRDRGFPMSEVLAKVDQKRYIPTNALLFSGLVCTLLSLIYIGSPVAYYAITSVLVVAVLQCYCLSIGCLLWRRIKYPETIPPSKFDLGRAAIPLNIVAIIYSLWAFFWAFWPQTKLVGNIVENAEAYNWSSALFLGVIAGASVWYVFVGRHVYSGPVSTVQGREKSRK